MANALEFILKLTDLLTPGMRQAAAVSDSAAGKIQGQFDRTHAKSKVMGASVDELRAKLDNINKVRFGTVLESEFNEATRAARKLENEIDRLENKGRAGSGLGNWVTGIAASLSMATVGMQAIQASAQAEMSKASYSTLLGSKDKGAAMYQDLNRFANETVFDNQSVYGNANTLLAFGQAGKDVLPIMHMLGDVSMGNADR